MPTQPFGWFKKPVTKVEDLKGVKFRTVGLAVDIYNDMGAAVNPLPGAEIVSALDRGLLDAAEFNNASSDRNLGFPDVAKNCMLQSFHQASEQFEILFNKTKYSALAPELKSSVVLELPVVDVFADMTAFTLARAQVQKMGYRVCLDGLTISSFINIDRKRLSLDLLKVQWNADVEADLASRQNVELARAVAECGHNRVILCRCDNKLAVDYGHGLGITLFQGRFIDSLATPTLAVAN
jgi:hypothetical protein